MRKLWKLEVGSSWRTGNKVPCSLNLFHFDPAYFVSGPDQVAFPGGLALGSETQESQGPRDAFPVNHLNQFTSLDQGHAVPVSGELY